MTNWREHFKVSDNQADLSLALKKNLLDETAYQKWASRHHNLPILKGSWFERKLDENFWNPIKDKAEWSSSLVPLCHWNNTLYIACLEPQELSLDQKTVFLLASVEHLEDYWSQLNSSIGDEEKKKINEFKNKDSEKQEESEHPPDSKMKSSPEEPPAFEETSSLKDFDIKNNEDIEYLPVSRVHKFKHFLHQLFFSPIMELLPSLNLRKPGFRKPRLYKPSFQKPKLKKTVKKDVKPEPQFMSLQVEEEKEPDNKSMPDAKKLPDELEKFSENQKLQEGERLKEAPSLEDKEPSKEKQEDKTILLLEQESDPIQESPSVGEQNHKETDEQKEAVKEEPLKELSAEQEEKNPEEKPQFVLVQNTNSEEAENLKAGAEIQEELEEEPKEEYAKETKKQETDEEKPELESILEKTQSHLDHYILFTFKDQKFIPFKWSSGLSPKKKMQGFISSPSIFRICYRSKKPYFGHLAPVLANNSFFENWGFDPPPNHVVLIPLLDESKSRILGGYLGISQTKTLSSNFLNVIQKLIMPIDNLFKDKEFLKKAS